MSEAFQNLPTGTMVEALVDGVLKICRIICKDEQFDVEPGQSVDWKTSHELVPGYFVSTPEGGFVGIKVKNIKKMLGPPDK